MDDAQSSVGRWWPAHDEDRKLPGVLEIRDDGTALLTVLGRFYEPDSQKQPSIVQGVSVDYGRVSLLRFRSGRVHKRYSPRLNQVTYEAWTVVLGAHVPRSGDLPIRALHAELPGLDEWVLSGTHLGTEVTEDGSITIRRRNPPPSCRPARHDDVRIAIRVSELFPAGGGHELSVADRVGLTIEGDGGQDHPLTLDRASDVLRSCQNLITLLRNRPVGVGAVWVQTPLAKEKVDSDEFSPPIRVQQYGMFHNPDHAEERASYYLRDYKSTSSAWPEMVQRWLTLESKLSSVLDLFFSTAYLPDMLVEHRFLSLTQACEAYHRVTRGGQYMNRTEYAKRVAPTLTAQIPKELEQGHRAALKSRIKYGYEFSLRKRLTDLVGTLPTATQRFFHLENAVARIVDTRNYLVHLDESSKGEAVGRHELPYVSYEVAGLLKGLLLLDLGLEESVVERSLEDVFLDQWHRLGQYRARRLDQQTS